MIDGGEIRSLGMFHPSEMRIETIQSELRRILPPCCAAENIGVAAQNQTVIHYDNQQWHQDGGGTAGTVRHMVVWASETPTFLRDSSGAEFRGEPFELMWFDNDKAFHRQPIDIHPESRWFVSVRCSGRIT
jgi:hypothetical protein